MTAEQVHWVAIIKHMTGCSSEELGFHLENSITYHWFYRFHLQDSFKKSTLNLNIKPITLKTWE